MSWYFRKHTKGDYYTCEPNKKTTRRILGDGFRQPAPIELLNSLDALGEGWEVSKTGMYAYNDDVADTSETPVELPGGLYTFHFYDDFRGNKPNRLEPTVLRADKYTPSVTYLDPVVNDIRKFLDNEHVYRSIGAIYKRGLLLYGPPGEGKTSAIRQLIREVIPKNAITCYLSALPPTSFIKAFPKTPVKVLIFEELAAVITANNLDTFLNFLDGETSLDNCLVIATTNYPEKLPGNIVDRPSRFDKLFKFGNPTAEDRRAVISFYMQREAEDSEVEATSGLSTAAVKEVCFLHRLYQTPVHLGVKTLKEHAKLAKSDFGDSKAIGLGRNDED